MKPPNQRRVGPGATRSTANASVGGRVLNGTIWFMGGTLIRAGLRLVVIGVLARLLVPADFGLVGAASIFIAFAELFSTSGIVYLLVQRDTLEPRHVSTGFTANLLAGIAAGFAIWGFAGPIADFFEMPRLEPVLGVLALLFPLNSMSAVSQKLLERELAYPALASAEVSSYVLGYAFVAVPLAWAGFGVWSLVYAQLGAAAVRSLLLMYYQPHQLRPSIDPSTYLEMMRSGAGYSLVRYAIYAAQKGDYFVVGRWLGPTALGLYERSYVLMDLSSTLLASTLHTILFPAFAKLQNDRERLATAFHRVSAVTWLIFLPAGMMAALLAPEIVAVILGSQWSQAVAPFRVLALGMVFRTGFRVSNLLANGMGAPYRSAAGMTVYAAFVVVGALLVARFGITAVAASTLFALAVVYITLTRLALELTGTGWRELLRSSILPGCFVTALTSAATLAAAQPLRSFDAGPLLVVAASSVVAVAAALLLFFLAPTAFGEHGQWLVQRLVKLSSDIRSRRKPD